MGINHAQIERRKRKIRIRQRNKHRPIDRRITLVRAHIRLNGHTRIPADIGQRRVREVELRNPSDKLRRAGRGRCNVAVIGTDGLAGRFPLELHDAARVGERDGAVVCDCGTAAGANFCAVDAALAGGHGGGGERVGAALRELDCLVQTRLACVRAGGVGLVEDLESREVLPGEAGLVGGAGGDVGCKESPGPGLRDAGFEPDGHGKEAVELAENHLLPSFGGYRLEKKLAGLATVEVVEKSVNTRLTEASKLLAKVEEFADRSIWIIICALHRGGLKAKNVREKRRVADFLIGHELD